MTGRPTADEDNRPRPAAAVPGTHGVLVNVALTLLAFGLAPFFKKLAIIGGASPWTVAMVSSLCAAAAICAIGMARYRGAMRRLFGRRHAGRLALVGLLSTALVALLVAQALTVTTATHRSLFQAAYPAATMVFAHAMLHERLAPSQYLALAALMCGLFVTNADDGSLRLGSGFWLLAATLPLIGYSDVYSKRLTRELPPLLIASGRSLYGMLFIAMAFPLLPAAGLLDGPVVACLAAAGLCQGLGLWTFYRALRSSPVAWTVGLVAAAPLVTAAAEIAVLDLDFAATQWGGAVLAIVAALWLARSGPDARRGG